MEGNKDPSFWFVIWEIAKWVLAALGSVVSAGGLWLLRMYGSDRAMLKRHDDWIRGTDGELGEQKKFREQLKLQPSNESMASDIQELKDAKEKLHSRISRTNRVVSAFKETMAVVQNDVKWICQRMGRKDDEE